MGLAGTCVWDFPKHVNRRHLKYVIRNIVSAHDSHLFVYLLINDLELFFFFFFKNFD